MIENILILVLLAVVSYIQNMAFTWTSRSRNSGDPDYHRYASWCSNGVWFICQILIVKQIWTAINNGDWLMIIFAGLVYVIATTEGSVKMMKILIKHETGKRKVGA